MTAHTVPPPSARRRSRGLALALVFFAALVAAAVTFISRVLWPTWPVAPVALDAPAIPITVAGVLFDVPPKAIRAAVQRHPGAHERIDLVFVWPALTPPTQGEAAGADDVARASAAGDRLFVTIAILGATLPPAARLRSIYPRYFETQATAGPDGLALLPFRAGTPYEGEDLIYLAENPEQFFARCTRPVRSVPGTCIHERSLDAAEITFRFPRLWLQDWRGVAAGFDRLMAQLRGR
jgi:hypothetical protein